MIGTELDLSCLKLKTTDAAQLLFLLCDSHNIHDPAVTGCRSPHEKNSWAGSEREFALSCLLAPVLLISACPEWLLPAQRTSNHTDAEGDHKASLHAKILQYHTKFDTSEVSPSTAGVDYRGGMINPFDEEIYDMGSRAVFIISLRTMAIRITAVKGARGYLAYAGAVRG
ncbi:hypothetical protein AAF712_009000 [Marasmius tenuissimus]|uniref:Uncharacterized protein n=1 Tax=Marasmius tenuissimus TaxID=585030 RepID=A0ABR2ZSL2_9AGAR